MNTVKKFTYIEYSPRKYENKSNYIQFPAILQCSRFREKILIVKLISRSTYASKIS